MEEFESFVTYNNQAIKYKVNVPLDTNMTRERSEHFGTPVSEEIGEVTYDVDNARIVFAKTENGSYLKLTPELQKLILDDVQNDIDSN